MKKIFVFLFFGLYLSFILEVAFAAEPSSKTLIIGGGPAGIATAIEAQQEGSSVTLIEKRSSYTREQIVFLLDATLELLDKWSAHVPEMKVISPAPGRKVGFVSINDLEASLKDRALNLGVKFILGEFKGLLQHENKALVDENGQERVLPYDILVGGDGSRSKVRNALGISLDVQGSATGMFAIVNIEEGSGALGMSPILKYTEGHVRKMSLQDESIIFMQFRGQTSMGKSALNVLLQKIAHDSGWSLEAEAIAQDQADIIHEIPIKLQQVRTFSDEARSAILVGDAAATASFFQGKGCNTALKTAEIAGRFFKDLKQGQQTAYANYNQRMKETTDAMLEDSRFLFKN